MNFLVLLETSKIPNDIPEKIPITQIQIFTVVSQYLLIIIQVFALFYTSKLILNQIKIQKNNNKLNAKSIELNTKSIELNAKSIELNRKVVELGNKANEITIYERLRDKWNSLDMLKSREQVCNLFSTTLSNKIIARSPYESVLCYFDEMGFYLKDNYINIDILWNYFCYTILRYYPITESFIEEERKREGESKLYENFDYLYEKIKEFSLKKNDVIFKGSSENINSFINTEEKKYIQSKLKNDNNEEIKKKILNDDTLINNLAQKVNDEIKKIIK